MLSTNGDAGPTTLDYADPAAKCGIVVNRLTHEIRVMFPKRRWWKSVYYYLALIPLLLISAPYAIQQMVSGRITVAEIMQLLVWPTLVTFGFFCFHRRSVVLIADRSRVVIHHLDVDHLCYVIPTTQIYRIYFFEPENSLIVRAHGHSLVSIPVIGAPEAGRSVVALLREVVGLSATEQSESDLPKKIG